MPRTQYVPSYPFGSCMQGRVFSSAAYRYGFNGKEEETDGTADNYDFGARIYDGRLGRWLSVDPLQLKYPMYSPFIGVNNSPLFYIDFDGKDWGVSTVKDLDGNETVTLKLTTAILNSSSNDKLNMVGLSSVIKSQMKTSYEIKYKKTIYVTQIIKSELDNYPSRTVLVPKEIDVTVVVQIETRVITKKEDLKTNEHLIEIKDNKDLPGVYGQANKIGGKEVYLNASKIENMLNGNDNNTIPHELGHTAGLLHVDAESTKSTDNSWFNGDLHQYMSPAEQAKNKNNIMFSGGSVYMNDKTSTAVTSNQIEVIREEFVDGDLNKT